MTSQIKLEQKQILLSFFVIKLDCFHRLISNAVKADQLKEK